MILSAVKVILKAVDVLSDSAEKVATIKKLAAPLVTLLSCEAEL